MKEHRRSLRKTAFVAIPVTNTMTDQVIGRIGNLSVDGLLLVCEERIADGALLQLGFEITDANGQPHAVEVGAQEMWSEAANVPGQYWAGFHFIDINDQDFAAIGSWLGEMEE